MYFKQGYYEEGQILQENVQLYQLGLVISVDKLKNLMSLKLMYIHFTYFPSLEIFYILHELVNLEI